jgi:hypothetical protein
MPTCVLMLTCVWRSPPFFLSDYITEAVVTSSAVDGMKQFYGGQIVSAGPAEKGRDLDTVATLIIELGL